MSPSASTAKILKLYVEERCSLSATAAQLGIKRCIVEREVKQAGCMRAMGEGVRLVKIGRPRLTLSLRDPDRAPVARWKIVEMKAAGMSNKEIARQLSRAVPNVFLALRKLGFPSESAGPLYSFGELFERCALRRLYTMSGLNVTEFAQQVGVPFNTTWVLLRGKKAGQPNVDTARKVSEWRSRVFQELMSTAVPHPKEGGYGQRRVILTFFPNLSERYEFLRRVLKRLGDPLRQNLTWSKDDLQHYLCEQAMLQHAGQASGDEFIQFLPWAPALAPFLASRLDQLRGDRYDKLAREVIGEWLKTTEPIIGSVIRQADEFQPIPPQEMRWLILGAREVDKQREQLATVIPITANPAKPKHAGGRPPDPSTRKRIELVADLELQNLSLAAMALQVYPERKYSPKAAKANTRKLASKFRAEIEAAKRRRSALESVN